MSKEFFQGITNIIQNLFIPTASAPPPSIPSNSTNSIIVQSGDTLGALGAKHDFDYKEAQIVRDGKSYKVGDGQEEIDPARIRPGDRVVPSSQVVDPIKKAAKAAEEQGSNQEPECVSGCCNKGAPTQEDYEKIANELGIEVCVVKAVAEVESRGNGFDGECKAKILYERHWFSKLTERKYDSNRFISAPSSFKMGRTNKEEHYGGWSRERFIEASAIDKNAAIQATSWGAFQIMGFNYKDAGFSSAEDFMEAMESSTEEQVRAFITFLINYKNGAVKTAMNQKNWARVAYLYNGEGYKINSYDTKMEKEYNTCKSQQSQ